MPVSVSRIVEEIEKLYPPEYAMEWDNSGFTVNLGNDAESVLVCLDVTPDTVEEAREKKCGLILAHHPLLFHPVKKISMDDHIGRCVESLVRNGVSLYCAHTSADCSEYGINMYLAEQLGLQNKRFLQPVYTEKYYKIAVGVPVSGAEAIKEALAQAGAGELGNYSRCTFSVNGEGTFLPNGEANPHIGTPNRQEVVEETWIQAVVPQRGLQTALKSVRAIHPYEEPAIDAFVLESPSMLKAGIGVIGELQNVRPAVQVLDTLKQKLDIGHVRFRGDKNADIKTIAVCGGACGDLIDESEKQGAQLLITGEVKHNQYMEAGICIAEAGHYDTEKCFCAAAADGLQKAIADVEYNVTVRIAESMARPYDYY